MSHWQHLSCSHSQFVSLYVVGAVVAGLAPGTRRLPTHFCHFVSWTLMSISFFSPWK